MVEVVEVVVEVVAVAVEVVVVLELVDVAVVVLGVVGNDEVVEGGRQFEQNSLN